MSPLERLALLSVPRDWRRAIAAAMQDEEADRSPIWRAAHIARIGGRLGLARGRDVLVTTIQGASPMRDSLRDLRLALRGLRRQPSQAAAIVATQLNTRTDPEAALLVGRMTLADLAG